MRGSPKEKPLSCMGYGVVGQLDIQRDSHRRRAPGKEEALRVRGVERGATVVSVQEEVREDPAVWSLQCLSPCQDLIFNPELLGATVIL